MNDMLENIAGDLLTEEQQDDCEDLTAEELFCSEVFFRLLSIKDPYERATLERAYFDMARKYNRLREFKSSYKAYKLSLAQIGQISNGSGKTAFPKLIVDGVEFPALNTGEWIANENGVRLIKENAAGFFSEDEASPVPILPTKILNNIDDNNKKIELSWYKQGKWNSLITDQVTVSSAAKIVELSNKGIDVTSENAKYLVKYLYDCKSKNEGIIPNAYSAGRMGWYGDKFIPYADDISFDGGGMFSDMYSSFKTAGDFEEWRKYVEDLRKDNVILRLVMGAAFVAPAISLVGIQPFILHLWGKSGRGKTVSIITAMSIWGDGQLNALTRTLNDTRNTMTSVAGFMHDLPCAYDELQLIKQNGGNYDSLIMTMCGAAERGRMTSNGDVRHSKKWNGPCLFSGEEAIIRSSSGAGAVNRVVEIDCTGADIIPNGRETVAFLAKNHGHAGKRFIDFILENKADLTKIYDHFVELLTNIDTTTKQKLVMSAIMFGDALGSACFFPDEKPLSADDVKTLFKSSAQTDTATRAYETFCDLMAINTPHFYRATPYTEPVGEFWGEIESEVECTENTKDPNTNDEIEKARRVWIIRSKAIDLLRQHGYELDAVKSTWADKGWLIRNSQGKMLHQTSKHYIKGSYLCIDCKQEVRN